MTSTRFRFPPSIGWFLAGALALAGCTSEGTEGETGSVGLNIDLGGTDGGLTIDEVQWVIVDVPGLNPVARGAVNVSQPGSTASFEKFGLMPGAYGVQLTATSTDGATACEGQAGPFTITANSRTDVSVLLNCVTDERLGAVRVDGTFNRCAELTMVTVSPLQVSVGFAIDVMMTADDDEGDTIAYAWNTVVLNGGTGSFDDASAATTTFTCTNVGEVGIVARVTDDSFAFCEDNYTVPVNCVAAPNCGNGILEPDLGEECDPSDPDGVPANWECDPVTCLRIPTCGDGIIDGPGEDCDPPVANFCDASCQTIDPCSPNPCEDGDSCTQNVCTVGAGNAADCAYPDELDGTFCDDFAPDSGACISGDCQQIPAPIEDEVSNVCVNSLLTNQLSYLPYSLTAAPLGPVVNGNPVDVSFTGIALVPASTLNTGIYAVPGLTSAQIDLVQATVAIRSGATGTTPTLEAAEVLPAVKDITINDDAAECAAAYPVGQNGNIPPCVTEPISVPLTTATGTLTPTGGADGEILVGWTEEDGAGNTASDYPVSPGITFSTPVGPTAIRVRIPPACVPPACIIVAWECVMGECAESGSGGVGDFDCGDGAAAGDVGGPLLDSQLLSIPIAP